MADLHGFGPGRSNQRFERLAEKDRLRFTLHTLSSNIEAWPDTNTETADPGGPAGPPGSSVQALSVEPTCRADLD